mmetsp:Transcript_435/g.707  ORF Transcript_435/g.707 Transcript_435/m.707 type:complete len:251 (-) Transcript_435:1374-2126(-)
MGRLRLMLLLLWLLPRLSSSSLEKAISHGRRCWHQRTVGILWRRHPRMLGKWLQWHGRLGGRRRGHLATVGRMREGSGPQVKVGGGRRWRRDRCVSPSSAVVTADPTQLRNERRMTLLLSHLRLWMLLLLLLVMMLLLQHSPLRFLLLLQHGHLMSMPLLQLVLLEHQSLLTLVVILGQELLLLLRGGSAVWRSWRRHSSTHSLMLLLLRISCGSSHLPRRVRICPPAPISILRRIVNLRRDESQGIRTR